MQIAVVHADHPRSRLERTRQLLGLVGLHQRREAKPLAEPYVCLELGVTQNRADEEHRVGTDGLCLVDHVLVHHEILAKDGDRDGLGDPLEVLVCPLEPEGLSEAADGIGARVLVLSRDTHRIEVGGDESP